MAIEWRPLDMIYPCADNPRRIGDLAVEKVAQSLRNFGWRQPIVVDRHGTIVVGHARLLAARLLKLATAPVHVADLSPLQVRAYRIADNRVAQEAEWNSDLLRAELADLDALGLDLPLVTGFDPSEIAAYLEPVEQPEESAGKAAEYLVTVRCRDPEHQAQTVTDLCARGYSAEPG
jgi:ParB-like chromosome segregation protein Spo0J